LAARIRVLRASEAVALAGGKGDDVDGVDGAADVADVGGVIAVDVDISVGIEVVDADVFEAVVAGVALLVGSRS
jgi:hypothetical protein